MNQPPLDPEAHFLRLAQLLTLEADAEARQILERARRNTGPDAEKGGECLIGLVVVEETSGLGGRCLLTLAKRDRTQRLPWNRFEPGAPVHLSIEGQRDHDGRRGVVSERSERSLCIALNEPPDDTERTITWRLDLASDEITRQRQLAALQRARSAKRDRLAELRQVLLGITAPQFTPEQPYTPLDPALNASQQEAVRFALTAQDVAVLHGPPGTGKTTTLVELIRQAVRRGQRVLACAPSNLAVDNLMQRLVAHGEQALRLGHPARVLPELRAHTLDLLVEEHNDTRVARKLVREAFALFRQAGKWTRAKPEPGAKRNMRQEGRDLLADARRLEAQAVEAVLNQATVVCATLTGVNDELLGKRQFDLAVIDEAGQCTEPACWLPLPRVQRVILAGDHCQLPPTIVSPDAAKAGFGVSLMERLVEQYGAAITRRLDVQYRMHEAIMTFSSLHFYDGALEAHDSVREHLLRDLAGVGPAPLTETPVQFIDTAGAGFDEELEPDGASRLNPREADLIGRKVRQLLALGIRPEDIGVIAPYAAQVRLLRDRLTIPGLEIDSVDGFQGREKEAILLSLVRSNAEGEVGFLADVRRTNVALTRARRKLLVIGDSATLSAHPFYQSLFGWFESTGAYGSVWEEPEDS